MEKNNLDSKTINIKEYIKEKELSIKALENYNDLSKSKYEGVENPIKKKFLAFQKTKREINPKDLF